MRCPQCERNNPVANDYCESCGSLLRIRCAGCGHDNLPSAKFCGACGSLLDTSHKARQTVGGSERKHATVLFADVADSTSIIAGLDPEEAIEQLRPVLAVMTNSVQRFGGAVVHALGDGVMALFGAPRAQEGHALLACKAALAMQSAMPHLDGAPTIRVGLHSGDVVAGRGALSGEMIDAMGVTVNIANRVEQIAEPGGIYLTSDCYRLVRSYCDARSLGLQPVRGLPQSMEIYQLLGLRPAVASGQFRDTPLATFCGREDEFATLQQALSKAEQGNPSVIGVTAAPGIGKSRLCYEFAEWCRRRMVPVLEARALPYGHAMPFQPVLETLRSFLRISASTEAIAAREQIAQRLCGLDTTLEQDLPLIYDFLGIPDPERPLPKLDPSTRHTKLRDFVHRLVRIIGKSTTVILVEDLHWLDESSEDFITTLVDAVEGTNILLVVNFRPSYAASWMKRPYYEELPLAELSAAQICKLTSELIGDDPRLQDIRRLIAERSGGNPFFAEELVRSLADSGILSGDPGRYHLGPVGYVGSAGYAAGLPATVQAVIGARIDRLGDVDKATIQIAAIIGKEFPQTILEQVANIGPEDAERSLQRLCSGEFILESAGLEGHCFAFRHPLIQEVAYAMQLRARRGPLHAAVAKASEIFYARHLDEFAGLIAHHYEAAGQRRDAAAYLQRAAMWVGKTDSAQALAHWRKVRGLMRDQPRSESNDRLKAFACGQILSFGWREGMSVEEARPIAEEGVRWSHDIGDTLHETLVLGGYGRIIAATGAADAYADVVKEALSRFPRQEDAGLRAIFNAMLSQACSFAGRLREALDANTEALASIADHSENSRQVLPGINMTQVMGFNVEHWIKCLRARIFVLLGQFDQAEIWLREVLQKEAGVEPIVQFLPHWAYVELAWFRKDPKLAEYHAQQVVKFAEQSGIPYLRTFTFYCTAVAKSAGGDFAGAIRDLSDGIDFSRRAKAGQENGARMLAFLADCHFRTGNMLLAADVAKEAIDVARRRTARLAECHASILRGAALMELESAVHDSEAALLFDRAEELIKESGAKIFEPLLADYRVRHAQRDLAPPNQKRINKVNSRRP